MNQGKLGAPLAYAAERILQAIGEMHRRNRTVASAYGAEVSVIDSSILVEVSANPTVSADWLCTSFQLSPVQMSRTLKKLEHSGILIRHVSENDRRSRVLRLTPKGQRVLDYVSERSKETFSAAYHRIPRNKLPEFTQLARRFCRNLSAPDSVQLPGDPPLLLEVRKLTRALGMLSPYIFGFNKLSPVEWHTLRLLQQRARYARDLCAELGVPANTMTGIIQRLETQHYTSKEQDPHDRRAWILRLTPAGHTILEECATCGRSLVSQGLRDFSSTEALDFSTLVDAYAGTGAPTDGIFLAPEALCKRLSVEHELLEARSFIFNQRVVQNLLEHLPEHAAHADAIVYALYRREELVALIDIYGEHVLHALASNKRVPGGTLERFLDQLRILLRNLGVKISSIPPHHCSKHLREPIKILLHT